MAIPFRVKSTDVTHTATGTGWEDVTGLTGATALYIVGLEFHNESSTAVFERRFGTAGVGFPIGAGDSYVENIPANGHLLVNAATNKIQLKSDTAGHIATVTYLETI